jgi:serine/threonine-protein kinase
MALANRVAASGVVINGGGMKIHLPVVLVPALFVKCPEKWANCQDLEELQMGCELLTRHKGLAIISHVMSKGRDKTLKKQGCEIIAEIGTGGMAVVYKAVQNSLNRPVAIKVLKPEYSTDHQLVARFYREATSLASLQHENIVHIYDFSEQDNSRSMIMEYVEGIDLFELLEQVHHIPPIITALTMLGVCNGLEYAHYRGIIHRDIKTSNIIVSYKGEVKLMDFGIARDESKGGDLTQPGTSLGTPAYMSPEQVMGVAIDFRSDIFSLGIVMYQMLTGGKPFTEGSGKSIMNKIINTDFVRPRRIDANIPRRLEKILMRCLAKEPCDRYLATGDLRRELDDFVTDRISMNYAGRMTSFLFHNELISRDEAETFVNPKSLDDAELIREDSGLPAPLKLKTIVGVQGVVSVSILLWILLVSALVGVDPLTVVSPLPDGHLKVVAWPWAELYIDGVYVDTTPVARSFSLPPGIHELTFMNPYFPTIRRKVLIESSNPKKIRVNLTSRQRPNEVSCESHP